MATNFPGEWEVRINYQTDEPAVINQHQLRMSMEMAVFGSPGDPFSDFEAKPRVGANQVLSVWVPATVAIIAPLFHTNVDFIDAELWRYTMGTFDAAFYSVLALGSNGTGVAATVNASQIIVTFRSQAGGNARVDLRGVNIPAGGRESFPTGNASINTLGGWITGALSPVIARDDGYLFAEQSYLPGQNERAWKALNR